MLGHARDRLAVLPHIPADIPILGVSHWGNFDSLFRRSLTRASGRRLVDRVHTFVFNTPGLGAKCQPWIPAHQQTFIPNTVEEQTLCSDAALAAKWANPPQDRPVRLLYLSNMIISKGYLDVLEALILLQQKGIRIEATFAGAWPSDLDRKGAESVLIGNGLTDSVQFLGPVSDRATVKALLLDADALAFPTYYPNEAHPVVIPEALNAGTPIISTHHASIPEMIRDDKEGYLIPKKDPKALAFAIERATSMKNWERLSRQARARFDTVFSPEAVGGMWTELIARVVNL